MKRAKIYIDNWFCGILTEDPEGYHFKYYEDYLKEAPAFTRGEALKLREFIKKSVVTGDNKELLYVIDNSSIELVNLKCIFFDISDIFFMKSRLNIYI